MNVELLRYPRGGAAPTGRVIEILGRPGDLGVDIEIIIRKHHLPHEFSGTVLEEAERRAEPVSEIEREGREDFRHLPIVTIDGETARDFDDAVYVERRADGGWKPSSAHSGRGALRSNGDGAGSGSAAARDVGLFSGPGCADAAGGAFEWDVLAQAARGAVGDERADGV